MTRRERIIDLMSDYEWRTPREIHRAILHFRPLAFALRVMTFRALWSLEAEGTLERKIVFYPLSSGPEANASYVITRTLYRMAR